MFFFSVGASHLRRNTPGFFPWHWANFSCSNFHVPIGKKILFAIILFYITYLVQNLHFTNLLERDNHELFVPAFLWNRLHCWDETGYFFDDTAT